MEEIEFAFPKMPSGINHPTQTGMTLRDYFAAKAMAVLMRDKETRFSEDASDAYAMADAMLKERAKQRESE